MTKCKYCGEFEAVVQITNPNIGELAEKDPIWQVCNDCEEIIMHQMNLVFGEMLTRMDDKYSKDYGKKVIKEANEKITEITDKSGTPTFSATITKKPPINLED